MNGKKSYGHRKYRPTPQNEYTTANPAMSAGVSTVLEYGSDPDDIAYKRRLMKRHAAHLSGRKKIRGWEYIWTSNDWQDESAEPHDESHV